MRIRHATKRSDYMRLLRPELAASAQLLLQGETIAVPLGSERVGYEKRILADIAPDEPDFLTDWTSNQPTRFPARLKAAATALQSAGIFGRFELSHHKGIVIVRRIGDASESGVSSWRVLIDRLIQQPPPAGIATDVVLICLLALVRAEDHGAASFVVPDLIEDVHELEREFACISSDTDGALKACCSRGLLERVESGVVSVPSQAWRELCVHPLLRDELISKLLHAGFPPSLHEALRGALGLPEAGFTIARVRKRDREFRDLILGIYERRCAACGFDGKLGGRELLVEAAHVRWHSRQGSDTADNGLALCTLHHAALDKGAIGVTPARRLLVSPVVTGGDVVALHLGNLEGRALAVPSGGNESPSADNIAWHRKWVFKTA